MGLRHMILAFCMMSGAALAESQPYAGQDARPIASLSGADTEALLDGQGWGFAKAAELNGYPGPAHILELADALELSDAQRAAIQATFDRMQSEARRLGAAFVAAEQALDAAFVAGDMTGDQLAALVAEAGRARAALRQVHLAAHLEAKPVLNRHQRMLYNRARGYGDATGHAGHDH